MTKIKAWVNAARLRTLPLSVSGVIVGTSLANSYGYNNSTIFFLAILTTICFQITSNFANDYGDGVKGTDNEDRIGPKRALQSGLLSRKELKSGIIVSIIVSFLLVIALVYAAFGMDDLLNPVLFIFLGVASIWAAIKYTVGNSAYGYKGMGDIFVFLFFGLLSVLGSMFLFTKHFEILAILPAITIGLLSTAVLNLNNLRDSEPDKKSGKYTMVVKMGFASGKKYHYSLLIVAFVCMVLFVGINYAHWKNIIVLIGFVPILFHLNKVKKTESPVLLDPELKKLAMNTFLIAILFYIAFNNFS